MRQKLLLALLTAATLAAATYALRPSPDRALSTTGIYADDWLANCGKLQGADQARCTQRLDDAYGRAAGAPLPPDKR